jgi:hypothetical protein
MQARAVSQLSTPGCHCTRGARRAAMLPPAGCGNTGSPAAVHCLLWTMMSPAAATVALAPSGSALQLAAELQLRCSAVGALALDSNLPPMVASRFPFTLQRGNQTELVICYFVTDSNAI